MYFPGGIHPGTNGRSTVWWDGIVGCVVVRIRKSKHFDVSDDFRFLLFCVLSLGRMMFAADSI